MWHVHVACGMWHVHVNNILISAQWVTKVADFGHSWAASAGEEQRELKGTPPYMAPEIILSRSYEKPVDVWAFGCVLCHVSSGKPPYSGLGLSTVKEVRAAERHVPAPHAPCPRPTPHAPRTTHHAPRTTHHAPRTTRMQVLETVAAGTHTPTTLMPADTFEPLRNLVASCVSRPPADRPTFDAICATLEETHFVNSLMGYVPSARGFGGGSDRADPRPIGRLRHGSPSKAGVKWDKVRTSTDKILGAARAEARGREALSSSAGGGGGGASAAPPPPAGFGGAADGAGDPLQSIGTLLKTFTLGKDAFLASFMGAPKDEHSWAPATSPRSPRRPAHPPSSSTTQPSQPVPPSPAAAPAPPSQPSQPLPPPEVTRAAGGGARTPRAPRRKTRRMSEPYAAPAWPRLVRGTIRPMVALVVQGVRA